MFRQVKIQKQLQGRIPPTENMPQIPEMPRKVQGDPQDYKKVSELKRIFNFTEQELINWEKAILLKDATTLSSSEAEVIKTAKELNLFDRESIVKLHEDSVKGKLPIEIDAKIKLLQIKLKEDGKYDGPINGIFDSDVADGIERLLFENDLFKEVKALSERFENARYERIETPAYNRNSLPPVARPESDGQFK